MVLECFYCGKTSSDFVSLYNFPAYGDLRNRWKVAIGRKDMEIKLKSHICSEHFHHKYLIANPRNTLLAQEAVPTLNLTNDSPPTSDDDSESSEDDESERIVPESEKFDDAPTPATTYTETDFPCEADNLLEESFSEPAVPICCIASCPSNTQRTGVVRLFTVPDDPKRKAIWTSILSNENVKFVKGSRICQRHFVDSFIVKGGSYIGQDGVEREYQNMNWRLTEDAVPSETLIEDYVKEKIVASRLPEKKFKVEKTCRTCSIEIEDEKDATPLFSGSLSLQKFRPDIFKELEDFSLKIDENDGLPQQICQKCLQSFSILIQFRKQCQRVQIDLVKYFKDPKNQQYMRSSDAGVITLCDNYSDDEEAPRIPRNSIIVEKANDDFEKADQAGEAEEPDEPDNEDIMMDDDILSDNEQNLSDAESYSENWTCEYYIGPDEKAQQQKNTTLKRKGHTSEVGGSKKYKEDNPELFQDSNDSEILQEPSDPEPLENENNSESIQQINAPELVLLKEQTCPQLLLLQELKNGTDLIKTDENSDFVLDKNNSMLKTNSMTATEEVILELIPEESNPEVCKENEDPELYKNKLKLHQCDDCNNQFTIETEYRNHRLTCSKRTGKEKKKAPTINKIVKCQVCREECENGEALENHMNELHAGSDLTPLCKICNRKYHSIRSLDAHLSRSHSIPAEGFKCDDCKRSYPSKTSLKEHVKRMHTSRAYKCAKCEKKFSTSRELRIHRSIHIPKKIYECQYCDKTFLCRLKKIEHETTHTGEKPHLCELCGRSFPFRQGFLEHIKGHTGSTEFKCDFCEKGFATKRKLYNHRLVHINGNYKALNCKYCDQKYEREHLIASHMAIVHGVKEVPENGEMPVLPYECEVCKKKFATEEKIAGHMRLSHNPEKPHECKLCGCRYQRCDGLATHIARVHERVKNHECKICKKKFFSIRDLDHHLDSHSKEKRHHCPKCEKKFKSKKGLKYHLKNHTMEVYSSKNKLK